MLKPVVPVPTPSPLQRATDRLMVLAALAQLAADHHHSHARLGPVHWAGIAALVEDISADIIEAEGEMTGPAAVNGGAR